MNQLTVFADAKKICMLGVGGAGLNSIAHALLDQGKYLIGADKLRNKATQDLEARGVKIVDDTDVSYISECDVVLASSAVKHDNPIITEAQAYGIPVLTRHDLWREWCQEKQVVAIAGSHGKTTVTGMIAHIIRSLELPYGYIVGTHGKNSGAWGKGEWLVIEADEYAKTLLAIKPAIGFINNIDRDHVDIYPDDQSYYDTFRQFAVTTLDHGSVLVASGYDSNTREIIGNFEHVSFGGEDSNWTAENIQVVGTGMKFSIFKDKNPVGECTLAVVGKHNVRNSLGVFAVCDLMKIDIHKAIEALSSFTSAGRRQEVIYNTDITIIDDYAHSPAEIIATVQAIENAYPHRRVISYFQPHTYSRVLGFYDDFISALSTAKVVRLGDVYGARETSGDLDMDSFLARILCEDKKRVGSVNEAEKLLLAELRSGDVLLVMNAGNASDMAHRIAQSLDQTR